MKLISMHRRIIVGATDMNHFSRLNEMNVTHKKEEEQPHRLVIVDPIMSNRCDYCTQNRWFVRAWSFQLCGACFKTLSLSPILLARFMMRVNRDY
jgi:ribosomal protein S14